MKQRERQLLPVTFDNCREYIYQALYQIEVVIREMERLYKESHAEELLQEMEYLDERRIEELHSLVCQVAYNQRLRLDRLTKEDIKIGVAMSQTKMTEEEMDLEQDHYNQITFEEEYGSEDNE
jgi:hypothetical protein